MFNKTFKKCHALAERQRLLKGYVPGSIAARVEGKASTGALYIYEAIGEDWWTGGGVTAKSVQAALDSLKGVKNLDIFINSEGGDVFEAKAIYAQLKRFDAVKTVHVDGIAASAATFIAMAGDKIITAAMANWMVHEAWGIAAGPAGDLRAYADLLDLQNEDIAGAYARKTGSPIEEMRALMAAETWMSATKALELKFTDEIAEEADDETQGDDKAAAKTVSKVFGLIRSTGAALASSPELLQLRVQRAANLSKEAGRASPPAKRVQPASR